MATTYSLQDLHEVKRKARVWKNFRQHPQDPRKVVCIHCWEQGTPLKVIESIPTRSIGSSTQSLTQHLTNQHGIVLEKGEPPQKQRKITYATVSKEEKKTLDLYVFRWLTAQHLPYSYVNHDKMKEMMSALRPGYVLPAVETLKSILTSSLTSMTNVIKTYLKEQCVGATLSADGWTATNGDPYFGIFLHLLDQEGNPQSILLNASPKEGAQTANALAQHVRCVLDASDTTAVMPAMVSLLGYVWIPCVGHLLNLTVQRAFEKAQRNGTSFVMPNWIMDFVN